ncbi:D-domain protein [Ancylostoma ceylanicum]|uniref:D-domain protein n=1 Tax=Ancylostoma ceylanicum TaxID=53326 RepID=A0A0D6M9N3_9BILA|nr:D-domain protein [Ancylostoma ceylanicum]
MADKVVGEIKAAGGQAVANYDSVEFGEKIVKTAIDAFGRVDIVINNAGILRDVSLVKMTDLDWDLIFKVHVKGAYSVTKAAWPYMRKQNYGRIIVTSSNAGIYGNFGQTNYAAAKSALVGFSNSLAQEGAKYNIVANALIPTAGSRLTQTVLPEVSSFPDPSSDFVSYYPFKSLLNALKPEYVTPLAVYLCHESFTESGKVFEAGAGWYGTLRDNWSKITDMKDAQHFESMRDMMSELMGTMSETQENGSDNHSAASSGSGDFPSNIKCSALFKEMNEGVQQDPSVVKNIKSIILYILTDGTKEIGKFTLDFKSASPSVYYGDVKNGEKPAATVTVSDDDFLDIASGKLNPQKAFMGGKLKVKGNVMLLQKLQTVLDKKRKAKL